MNTNPIMKNILKTLFILSLSGCSTVQVKPFFATPAASVCYSFGKDTLKDQLSEDEKELIRNGALTTNKILLNTIPGMIESIAKVYIVNQKRYVMCFHMLRYIGTDISNYEVVFLTDYGEIHIKDCKSDKVAMGEIIDEVVSFEIPEVDFIKLAKSSKLEGSIDEISFKIPFPCREEWRSIKVVKTLDDSM